MTRHLYCLHQERLPNGGLHLEYAPVEYRGRIVQDVRPPTYSDEYLEFWAELYADNQLWRQGIGLEQFLAAPEEVIDRMAERDTGCYADDYEPLLPAQARVARRIELQTPAGILEQLDRDPTLVVRNGTYMELLHHRRWPRNPARRAG